MTVAFPGPSWAVFRYTSDYAQHAAQISTREWNQSIGTRGHGGFTGWGGLPIDAADMYDALLAALVPFHNANTTFDEVVTYMQVGDGPAGVPVDAYSLTGIVGTSVSASWHKASQHTLTMYDTDFSTFKIVMLDVPIENDFDRVNPGDFNAKMLALVTEVQLPTNAWSSRRGNQPGSPRSFTKTMSEALRKQYKMT